MSNWKQSRLMHTWTLGVSRVGVSGAHYVHLPAAVNGKPGAPAEQFCNLGNCSTRRPKVVKP